MSDQLTKDDLEGMISNPFYAVTFAAHMFKEHTNLSPREDWVVANVHTMQEIGVKTWLKELLDVLSQSRAKYDGHDIINPALVSSSPFPEHQP